jgi:Mn-dependent DtxR family transcriptional regulator
MTENYTLKDSVFRAFLRKQDLGPTEMAEYLDANYNSIKAAFAKLADEGLLDREGRGNYIPDYSGIILYLMDKIESLEERIESLETITM